MGAGSWIDAASGVWQAYTPSWTGSGSNPTIGNGTLTGSYCKIGKFVEFYITITGGSTTNFGSGNYSFSLPTTADQTATNFPPIGNWAYLDNNTGNNYLGFASLATTTTLQLLTISIVTSSLAAGIVAHNAPVTMAQDDKIQIKGSYKSV